MSKILLHPNHRKIIKLLKWKIKQDGFLIVTLQDKEEFLNVIQRTQIAFLRHKGIYRILLRIINRNSAATYGNKHDFRFVELVENIFAKVERKNLYRTVRNILLRPLICKTIHLLNRRNNEL